MPGPAAGLGRRTTKTADTVAECEQPKERGSIRRVHPLSATNVSTTTAYVCLTDSSGMGQVISEYETGGLVRHTTYGSYVDEPLSLHVKAGVNAGSTYWYHLDRQYNVIGLTNSAGAVVERYAYTAYGARRVLDPNGVTERSYSALGNARGHQGLWHDDESGLIYNRARYRSSALGRWMGRDKLGYVDGWSLYLYVGSEPLTFVDPSGEASRHLERRRNKRIRERRRQTRERRDYSRDLGNRHRWPTNETGREFCGYVCRHKKTGKISHTTTSGRPHVGSCSPNKAPCPKCTKAVSIWHTHPQPDSDGDGVIDFAPEDFSQADKDFASNSGLPITVNTPGGKNLEYNPRALFGGGLRGI
ncbi:MAG: RHS repeat-associated core domain-containing protein [Algisphaera sp.]